ncbi:hypothetical protein SAMN05444487_11850 [Marininema mesophilum]|uniref:Uncharacterized protein n=1 Tax=Marininema mesophilum TaxID=1048340 RepID=A0A1H3BW20_9BACL|nr:hypothetical protein [Marininema mesophilum]SDX45915.1 hypothetical protein SAMN05444487_11850 [Marininema mesophilum]
MMIQARYQYDGTLKGIAGLKRGDQLEIDGTTYQVIWVFPTDGEEIAYQLRGMGIVLDRELERIA